MKFEEYKGHVGPVIAILSAQVHHKDKKGPKGSNSDQMNNHP